MKVEIYSKIVTHSLSALENVSTTNNEIIGSDTVADIVAGFKVLNCEKQTLILDSTSGPLLNETIDVTNASFIHIQCNKYITSVADTPDRRRFAVNYNGSAIGNMSQFQVIDCDDIKALAISNVVVPTGEKAVFTIIKGLHI